MIHILSRLLLVATVLWMTRLADTTLRAAEPPGGHSPKIDATYSGLKYKMPEIMLIIQTKWPELAEHQDTLAQFIKSKGFNAVGTEMNGLDALRRNKMYARLWEELRDAPQLKNDPAVFCYFISDDRTSPEKFYPKFAAIARAFEKADPNHPTMYISLAYQNQFQQFVDIVKPNLLLYAHGQWDSGQHQERDLLYMGKYRELALKHDIPLLRFTNSHCHQRVPPGRGMLLKFVSPAQLRQEHFTSLAYGVKGFQYPFADHFDFKKDKNGPVLENGKLVPILNDPYIPLSEIAREIQTLSPVLVKLKSLDVLHADPLPQGGKKPPEDFWIGISGEQTMIGVFQDEKGIDYLMPVNYDASKAHETTLRLKGATAVERMDKHDGKLVPLTLEKKGDAAVVKLKLAAGDGELLKVVRAASKSN